MKTAEKFAKLNRENAILKANEAFEKLAAKKFSTKAKAESIIKSLEEQLTRKQNPWRDGAVLFEASNEIAQSVAILLVEEHGFVVNYVGAGDADNTEAYAILEPKLAQDTAFTPVDPRSLLGIQEGWSVND